jgi:3,4-dihydroxyphenylacetate 2,3-dioxygenase
MGEVIGAGLLSHVPTIVLPDDVRREINNGNESSLYTGLHQLRREVFDNLKPDLVIVFDSHWFTTVEFVITAHERRRGFFTSEELPRGMSSVPFDFPGNSEFARLVGSIADVTDNCWITPIDNIHLPISYATINFLSFLQGPESWMSVSCCQTGAPEDFLLVGSIVAEAVRRSDLRVVLIASGALSHTFHTLQRVRETEAADPRLIFSPEARAADERVIAQLCAGDHAGVLNNFPEFAKFRPEAHFGHYLLLAGALGGTHCTAPARPYSEYENAIGTGQIHLWFDQPAGGWTGAA